MRRLLVFLLFLSLNAHSQLSGDSLKSICTRYYKASHSREYNKVVAILADYPDAYHHLKIPAIESVELFDGYFPAVKIYSTFYSTSSTQGEGIMYPMIYALDANTGEFVNFKSIKAFNEFIHSSTKTLVNLDKAYLCLYTMMQVPQNKMITFPEKYAQINAGSIFRQKQYLLICQYPLDDSWYVEVDNWSEKNVDSSNNNSIYIFARHHADPYGFRYHCTFDEQSNLDTAVTDTFGNMPQPIKNKQ